MFSLALTFAGTFCLSVLLTLAIRAVAIRADIVDRPDGVRKIHSRPTPLLGGVSVYVAMILGLGLAWWSGIGSRPKFERLAEVLAVTAGCVCLFGAWDDCYNLRARSKLLLQVVAVLPMVVWGCWVERIVVFGYEIQLGWLGIPLTVFWLVGCINALNLLDGMDGLASLVGLSTALMMGLVALGEGHPHVALAALVLAAALAGFLVFNLPPASIFLGDSGSMVIGLAVGLLGIQGDLKTSATLSITAPAVVMALPLLDVVLAVIRRRLSGRPLAGADRQHIHHRLLDRGFTPRQVLWLATTLCLLTGSAAATATIYRNDTLAWIAVLTVLVLAIRLRLFGHYEFRLAKQMFSRAIRRAIVRLLQPAPARPAPELAHLRFDDLWSRLLGEVQPLRVRRLEVTVSRGSQVSRHRVWSNIPRDEKPCCLTLALPGVGDGQCELRAWVGAPRGRAPVHLQKLARLLHRYAAHLAERVEDRPTLTLVFPEEEIESGVSVRGKAA